MTPYIAEWKKLGLQFDGICSGFLGSKEQIRIVQQFFQDFKTEENCIIVDPVMGDYGKTYSTYTQQMCEEMKKLVGYADILTPNVTEACILTDTPYREKFRMQEYARMGGAALRERPEKIVITGIVQGDFIANYCYDGAKSRTYYAHIRSGHSAPVPAIFLRRSLRRMRSTVYRSTSQ